MSNKSVRTRHSHKSSTVLHYEDWNSRFWIETIPEYKSLFSTQTATKELNLIKNSNQLNFRSGVVTRTSDKRKNHQEDIKIIISDQVKHLKTLDFSDKTKLKTPTKTLTPLLPNKELVKNKIFPVKNRAKAQSKASLCINSENYRENIKVTKSHKITKDIIIRPSKSLNLKASQKQLTKPSTGFKSIVSDFKLKFDESLDLDIKSDSSSYEEDVSILILDSLNYIIFSTTDEFSLQIISESINEAVIAYLMLSSSKILYSYINELLDSLIPQLSKSWFDESKEQQASDLRDILSDEVKEQEIQRMVNEATIDLISGLITEDYLELVHLTPLVNECIEEIIYQNHQNMNQISDYLIEELVQEDWVEILVEDLINMERIQLSWKLFPFKLQKEIAKQQHSLIVQVLAEDLYFEMINKVVADYWLGCLCRSILYREEDRDENIMPVKTRIREQG